MNIKPSKFLMNEEGGSPGGGAAPTPPAEQPADTAAAAPAGVTLDQVKGLMTEMLTGFKNATFAELRRAGAFGKDKAAEPAPAPAPSPQPTPSAPAAAQAGLVSMDEVQLLLARRDVVSSRVAKYGLNEAQAKRFEAALSGVPRDQLPTEADAYLNDLGLAKAPQPATAPAQAAAPVPAKPNISDRGSAAPTDMRDSDGVVNSRPLEITGHDMDSLILKHGEAKALQMFQERALAALRGVRIRPPGRR